ncbi:hypothetical protein JL720_7667 [Aureococcus anophagefferens]|nr:hypothetical protein JL720_7667 [Aureococcus anophagefferens]
MRQEGEDRPSPRSAHTLVIAGEFAYMFGGCDKRRPPGPNNELYKLDMSDKSFFYWSKVPAGDGGAAPAPRWHHTAHMYNDRTMLVFGGFSADKVSRYFNDLWLYDTKSEKWSQPPPAETPRGAHASTLVGSALMIFGGYGGSGFSRRDFADLHSLDMETMEWEEVETTGEPPEARSGHQLLSIEDRQLYVMGGWNSSRQFDDVHVVDLATKAWSQPAMASGPDYWGPPRWNFTAVAVFAVPFWKIFVFGGNSGDLVEGKTPTGEYCNDIMVLECGENVWLRGMGFSTVKGEVTVRYACPKGFEVGSCGTVIDDQTITFETPNYEHYGAVEIECRVSIGPKPLTNSKVKMSYFSVTDASQCLAFGPGLVNGCIAGNPTTICIVAKDEHGNNRSCGMDEFSIRIEPPAQPDELKDLDIEVKETKPDKDHDFDPQFAIEPECTDAEELKVQVELSDSGDGTYVAAFAAPVVGTYTITIEFMGTFDGKAGPVRGSPFQMTCVDRDEYIEKNPKDIRLSEGETEPSDELLSFNNSMDGPIVTNDVLNKIKEIREFSNKKKRGLQKLDPTNYDAIAPLIEGKEHLRDIEKMSEQYALCIDTTRVALAHLKSRGNQVDRMMDQLGKAIVDWTEVLALVEPTATAITPTTIHFANKTVGWIEEYEQKIKDLDESFRGSKVFSMEVGHDDALKMLDKNEKEFVEETKILEKNAHLCAVFEFPEKINKSQEILQTMQKTVDFMRAAWGVSEDITCFITDAKALLWRELEIEDLEDGAKAQTKKLSGLNKTIRWCPLYKDTSRAIKDFINTIPLITALRSKAMRPRHWDLLRKATGKEFTPPYEDEDLQLGGLLSLNLHEFNADVEEICDQATKEEKIEEEDWESLENDQLTVQGMMASRYIAQFEKEVASWQVALVTISDVYTTINEIQRTCFAGIDVEIKDVLTSAWEVKNIKEACNVDGLLSRLEGELGGLDLCKNRWPTSSTAAGASSRYYFTSEADLLDILSNGSQPEKVMIHTSKIYLSTKTLRLDPENRTASNRPMAVGWVAVGKEYTPFEPAVPLEGKVEIYMQTVLDAMKSTLFQNLKRSVIRYAQMERKHWVMAKDEDGARPADPAQIILLTLAINYVQEVEESFEKIEAGNEAALAEYNVLQIDQLGDLVRLTQGDLDGENRTRIMVCITMDAHGRDIVQKLVRERVNVVSAFQWQSQLKHKFRVPPSYASHIGRDPHLRSSAEPEDGLRPRAGTGKTESTKDLASALAKCCYVFNCSPEMDYKGLGNIFKGLGSSGSWGCFDEFNRCPRGLKALFRPMTVMVPDLVLICENMLMAQGFVDAKSLASKFYGLYSLLKELLSKQLHYDWGLRAVKSVLVIAGTMKRADPQLPEDSILMRALRDSNIPKIVKEDQVVFFGLLGDLFPGINPERKRDMNLEDAIVKACGDLGLDPDDEFCLKTVQLEELLAIRHCVFVMGPRGRGQDVNPKSVKTEELYGFISMATREWRDGLLSVVMRNLGRIEDELPKWILLDGDLDANWIESMNSVMDDNRMLTLASNERIPLKPHMRMIFEIRDLKHATPATVSRAGILYISTNEGSQWRSLIAAWIKQRPESEECKEWLREICAEYVGESLDWMKLNIKTVLPLEDMNLVQSLLYMLALLLKPDNTGTREALEIVFNFCLIWALGSPLGQSDDGVQYRALLSDYWRGQWKNVKFPTRGASNSVFDYYLEPKSNQFEQWSKSPFFYHIDFDTEKMNMAQITVPTAETCSVAFWMSDMVKNHHPVMLAGPSGTGKTQQAYLVYFVDDLNLPEVDSYNTQSAIALLRQQMEYGHIYDMTKLAQNPVKNISKTQVVACMNPTAGSFVINPRLQRWFVTFAIGMPSRSSLNVIYDTFLMGHLKADFPAEVASLKDNIIKAAMNLHKEVMEKFRKTATNFHYEFNIRHLANVFQGLLVAQAEQITTGEKLVHLWLHESERVYGDRLVSPEDLRKYNDLAQGQARKLFQQFPVDKFYAKENSEPLIFCHFCEDIEDPIYDQITGIDKMLHTLEGALELYNESNAVMDLVLFEDAMKHVARISRIVLNEGGHALLVGVGGSGKQSLSRLAAFICHYTVTQIVISSSYSITDLKDDLKGMYNKAGLKEEGVMFLLTDSQITNERFLIYINDLLASGNIPDLFAVDEVDNIVNSVANRVKAAGLEQTRANCWDYFITEIRRNLHVVLAFSPVGDDFRNRSRKFPALVNSTVIDWFQPWPEDALLSVGQRFLEEIDVGTAAHRTVIEKFMPYSFIEVNNLAKRFQSEERRHVYTTPKSFLELLKLYQVLLEHKREDSDKSITRLKSGLKKMQDKKTKAEGISEVVSKEKAIVEVETAGAEQEAAKVAVVQKDVGEKQRSTAEDLAKAEPAVEAAMAALDSLDAKSLAECKSMIKPPAGVDDIFISTMILLADIYPAVLHNKKKVKDRSWDAAKKQCLGNIKEYIEYLKMIKVKVDESVDLTTQMKEIRPYLALEHFKVEIIAGKNSAAAGLTAFVLNIVTYYDIVITVEPKRIALAEANAQLEAANAKLKAVNEKVADLQSKLAILTDNLDVAERDKQEALDVEKGQRKLDLAQRLTSALASENERWKESVIQMEASKNLLTGDVLLASSFISYAGPFTKSFRDILMQEKFFAYLIKSFNGGAEAPAEGAPEMPMSPTFDPISILTTDAEIAVWNQDSLPADAVSTENGSILCNTSRWPLIIDPQLQGISWLRNKESAPARNLQIVRLGQKDMMRKLERALESGHTILIENLSESLDAVLSPIIQRATIKRGRTLYVKVGDSEVEFHPNFRLYLHTKLSNPHYPPEIQAETTLINFTVTQAGLSDQLLTLVVQKERGDLAELAESLIKQQNGFKIKMKELEDSILEKLANAEGDITEDVDLIEGLEETKRISIDINKKSAIANETQANIRITSNKYKSVADRSSQLFFLMNDLAKIHSYYVYSLAAFTKVFYRGIDLVTAKKAVEVNEDGEEVPPEEEAEVVELNDEELAARCVVLMNSITLTTFNYIRRGLFEKDKLTIATMVTLRIAVSDEVLSADDVGYLYLGKIATDPGNMGPLHEWMPEAIWPKVKALEGLKRFNGLGDNMHSDSDEWLAWFDNATPENAKLPGDYQKLLTPFDRLILLRALRPDRVSTALRLYIGETMGNDYVFQAPFNMPATYDETSSQTPVFFVLFPGVDPTPWVEDLGKELNISQDNGLFCNISMGQGQEKPAEAVLERFAKTGGWVMLQNCHLMTSWVPQLERLLEVVQESAHDDFRCFISAEPPGMAGMKNMPESLLQSCVKVSNEAPADIKSNLTRAWDNFNQGRIDACTKPDDFKSCLFSLCWFHAIVLGRRRFGAQGWSRKYSFNTGDLVICSNVLSSYLDANVPWDDLRYIFGEIMYGGHITDAWDRRTCNTYLLVLMLPALREGLELGPKFKSPDPTTLNYDDYLTYVNAELPEESPPQFGLHPNAEIGYLTSSTADLFATIMSLGGGSGGGGGDSTSIIKATMTDLKERCPEVLEMLTIGRKAEPLLEEPDKGPYIVCALQECRRMNVLIGEIGRTLMELEKGLGGQLNMTQAMEDLCSAFLINQWPGRNPFAQCTWEKNAWPSKKGLVTQFADMLARYAQLAAWTEELVTPISVWLSGLFNPMAYLTGVTQVTRATGQPLDKMTQETHVTTYVTPTPSPARRVPESGAFVHGLFIEGAVAVGDEVEEAEEFGGASVGGVLLESRLKELMPPMPVLYIKAVPVQVTWEPSAVGYLRHVDDIYECPVFITTMRGPTYIFLATLKTAEPKSKWTLTGTALMMQTDD